MWGDSLNEPNETIWVSLCSIVTRTTHNLAILKCINDKQIFIYVSKEIKTQTNKTIQFKKKQTKWKEKHPFQSCIRISFEPKYKMIHEIVNDLHERNRKVK